MYKPGDIVLIPVPFTDLSSQASGYCYFQRGL